MSSGQNLCNSVTGAPHGTSKSLGQFAFKWHWTVWAVCNAIACWDVGLSLSLSLKCLFELPQVIRIWREKPWKPWIKTGLATHFLCQTPITVYESARSSLLRVDPNTCVHTGWSKNWSSSPYIKICTIWDPFGVHLGSIPQFLDTPGSPMSQPGVDGPWQGAAWLGMAGEVPEDPRADEPPFLVPVSRCRLHTTLVYTSSQYSCRIISSYGYISISI